LKFDTKPLPLNFDDIAPDGSEIRLLPGLSAGGPCHYTLSKDCTSKAIRHRTVEEIWYFIQGQGEVWRRQETYEEEVPV
jgi:mannose-6-phosphate isomerase-like protein (cupin superfamily)